MDPQDHSPEAADTSRRLFVYNGGLLARGRVRRMLELAGWEVRTGQPRPGDFVGVWGASPTSPRGEAVAALTGAPVVRVEDGFLRSLHPGRSGEPPLGLMIDEAGVHFDSSKPSHLENLLATQPFDETALLDRARAGAAFMRAHHLSKYAAVLPDLAPPDPGYVLVIDQTRGDASVEKGGASATTFREMLVFAQTEHPDAQIIIKAHPETIAGHRDGYFGPADEGPGVTILHNPVSPWRLFEHARAVYTVSSGLGFEAIYAGHKPRVFGQPFYAGWGLTVDENPIPRRGRPLTRSQLFAGAMILAATWYDPYRDRLASMEETMQTLAAQARAWREDQRGWVAAGMRRWKHRHLKRFFARHAALEFMPSVTQGLTRAAQTGKPLMVWGTGPEGLHLIAANKGVSVVRIEDGVLRSRGLGAKLTAPLSLVTDRSGIYYDAQSASDLENLIAVSATLEPAEVHRAERLITAIIGAGLSKYNTGTGIDTTGWPDGPRVLVAGQVEDDASILLGCGNLRSNLDLVRTVREAVPNGCLIYKPHPDVLAGLRKGAVEARALDDLADIVLGDARAEAALAEVEAVWTLTSTLGFEALLRGLPVTCLGAPFYAGWGLTRDFGTLPPERRRARPTLAGLAHAVLIGYPRYCDPVTGLPCPPEVIVDRLATGTLSGPDLRARLFSIIRTLLPG